MLKFVLSLISKNLRISNMNRIQKIIVAALAVIGFMCCSVSVNAAPPYYDPYGRPVPPPPGHRPPPPPPPGHRPPPPPPRDYQYDEYMRIRQDIRDRFGFDSFRELQRRGVSYNEYNWDGRHCAVTTRSKVPTAHDINKVDIYKGHGSPYDKIRSQLSHMYAFPSHRRCKDEERRYLDSLPPPPPRY